MSKIVNEDFSKVWESQEKFISWVKSENEKYYNKTGKKRLAFTHTYGCQQNVSDGETIDGMLEYMGFDFAKETEEADFILYNTCAVRENAEDRVFGNVGAIKHYKETKPELIIALCGCMMQQEHIVEKIKKSYPFVDLVFGTHLTDKFPELLYHAINNKKRVFETKQLNSYMSEGLPIRRENKLKAWLPIMNGCDNFCTYCIVPYVRGRECSRHPQNVINDVKNLVAQGYKDITLLGQNVNSYGKGLEENITFAQLLEQVNNIEGDFWIRFMTSHPKDCTKELIDTIARCDKVCKHIHLPVQCGSDDILKKMNRHYDTKKYLELVKYAKEKINDVVLTSDIIVGFPQETYEDFKGTLNLIKEVRYESLYTFIYSKRVGTPAAKLEDPISDDEKSKWFRELLNAQQKIGEEKYQSAISKTVKILVDGVGKTQEGFITGRTQGNIIVECKGNKEDIGKFINVKITNALRWALIGDKI